MCALFRKIGMEFKKGALKLTGSKISEDEEYHQQRTVFNADHKRVVMLQRKVKKALNDTRGIITSLRKAGAAYVDMLSVLHQVNASTPIGEEGEMELPEFVHQFQASFGELSSSVESFNETLRSQLTEVVTEKVQQYRELDSGLLHNRENAKLALDRANSAVERMEKKPNADPTKMDLAREKATTAQSSFDDLDGEAATEMRSLVDTSGQFVGDVASPFVSEGKGLIDRLTGQLGAVSGALDGVTSEFGSGSSRRVAANSPHDRDDELFDGQDEDSGEYSGSDDGDDGDYSDD